MLFPRARVDDIREATQASSGGRTGKSSLREGQANQLEGAGDRWAEYLGVEDIAGNAAEHEQPVFPHGPGDTQPGHPLQGALVGLVVVTHAFALFFLGLF